MQKLKNSELGRVNIEEFKSSKKMPIIVILDNIRSLNNIGSVFRTCDAFLIEKIYLCGITATPPHNDIRKTALGATDSIEWEYSKNVLDVVENLKKENVAIVSIEQVKGGTSLQNFTLEKNMKYGLIFGNEVKGVQQNVVSNSDFSIEIPQFGTKHSLNIAVSCGIVLWEFFRKINYE